MIDPGRMKTRLVIEAPNETDDGQGGVTRDYVAAATVWAAVLPGRAQRRIDAEADGAAVALRIVMRAEFALTLRHRLVDDAKIYRIIALRAVDDGRFTEIDAEWRID